MEKIERLANLNPKTEQVSGHSLEMFRLLRSYAMLDWVLRHPNDLGSKRAELKFEKLVERTWQLMDAIQGDLEGKLAREADIDPEGETPSLIIST